MFEIEPGLNGRCCNQYRPFIICNYNRADRTSYFQTISVRTQAAFLTPYWGEKERRYFYTLMLRSRAEKSLVSSGFAGAVLTGQGVYTLPLKIGVLLRNKSTVKGVMKQWQFSG